MSARTFDELFRKLDFHSPKGWAHPVGAVDFAQFHASDDQTGHNLAGSLDNRVLGGVHIQASHSAKLLDLLHTDQSLDAESPEWPIVTSSRDDHGSIDGVGIHTALIIMMHSHQSPIGNDACDANSAVADAGVALARDQIFDCGGVKELNVGELQHFGQQSRSEESGVLDDDEISLVFVGNAYFAEKCIGGFAHHHCREELTTEPGSTSCV